MNQQTKISLQHLAPGFHDPQLDAQRVFRQLLQAMARPGQIVPIDRLPEAPKPLSGGAAALALTLFDLDTPIWLDEALRATAGDYLAFHTGAPVTADVGEAAFVLVADGRHSAGPEQGRARRCGISGARRDRHRAGRGAADRGRPSAARARHPRPRGHQRRRLGAGILERGCGRTRSGSRSASTRCWWRATWCSACRAPCVARRNGGLSHVCIRQGRRAGDHGGAQAAGRRTARRSRRPGARRWRRSSSR